MSDLAEPTLDLNRRVASLDALRGVAALLVVTFHCAQVTAGFAARNDPTRLSAWADPWTWLKYTPLRLLVSSGPPAVVLFFMLSGFVLSLPFLRSGRQISYAAFASRRICRIYLPFAAAILFSASLYALVRPTPIPALSHWFNTVAWDQALTPGYVGRNLAMTGVTSDMTLDVVMWSLVHELRISLVFPLLFLVTRRYPILAMGGSLALSALCTEALGAGEAQSVGMSFVDTGRFVFLFTAGIIVGVNAVTVRNSVARLSIAGAASLWFAAAVLLLSPGPTVYRYFDLTWGAGAVLLLMLTLGSLSAHRTLSAGILVWLGRVSYSLYLVHLPLLIAAVHCANGLVPLWLILPAVILASLLCAEVMHRAVEIPSIRLGRLVARRLEQANPDAAVGWRVLRETRP